MTTMKDRPRHLLHEAIQIVLSTKAGRAATSTEISDEIDRRKLYWKMNGKKATPSQISARANNKRNLFKRTMDRKFRLIGGVKLLPKGKP